MLTYTSRSQLDPHTKAELDNAQACAPWGWYVTVTVETSPPQMVWTARYYFGGKVNACSALELLNSIQTSRIGKLTA